MEIFMKQPALTKRLKRIYDFIGEGDRIVDVGSDHGLLPVYALMSGKCPCAFATDISRPSLQKTIDLAQANGIELDCACCDGLAGVPDGIFDTVVIAGMGGLLIADILKQNPLHSVKKYILQPMTAQYELRQYLNRNQYSILQEALVKEDGKIYNILTAVPNRGQKLSEKELRLGFGVENEPLYEEYLERKISRIKMILANLQHSRTESGKKQEAAALLALYENCQKSFNKIK